MKVKWVTIKAHVSREEFDQNNGLLHTGKKSKLVLKGEDHIFRDLYFSFSTENYSRCESKMPELKIK